jgi:F420H(2)-dependent quinone reductase
VARRRPTVAERIASSRPGSWFFLNVANPIDKRLIPATNGRISLIFGRPILVLEHRGAKSGKLRRTPIQYFMDGDRVVLIASSGGAKKHPGWYHNLRANPDVRLFLRGRSGDYVAYEAEGEERERLWAAATDLYTGYDAYQGRAGGRRIPVMVFRPKTAT